MTNRWIVTIDNSGNVQNNLPITFPHNTNITGTLGITSNETVGGTLGVTGATTLSSIHVTGNSQFDGTITGNTNLGILGVGTFGYLSVTNNETISGTLGVTGATTLTTVSSGTQTITGNETISGTLGVTGNTTVGGTLGITGNTTVGGTLGVTGQLTTTLIPIVDYTKTHFHDQKATQFSIGSTTPTKVVTYDGLAVGSENYGTWNATTGVFTFTREGLFVVSISGLATAAVEAGKFNFQIATTGQTLKSHIIIMDNSGHDWVLTGIFHCSVSDTLEVDLSSQGASSFIGSLTSTLDLYIYSVL